MTEKVYYKHANDRPMTVYMALYAKPHKMPTSSYIYNLDY